MTTHKSRRYEDKANTKNQNTGSNFEVYLEDH